MGTFGGGDDVGIGVKGILGLDDRGLHTSVLSLGKGPAGAYTSTVSPISQFQLKRH